MNPPSLTSAVPLVQSSREGSSREFDLLCACAGTELSPERVARIAALSESPVSWSEVFGLAEHHGVLALVARKLWHHASGLSAETDQRLRVAYEENARRNLWFAGELLRIVQHSDRRKLRILPFKGPVLAESAYGDIVLRHFNDLDFLIAPEDFPAAKRILAELGYQSPAHQTASAERIALRTGYELAFDGPAGKNLVELQWRLVPEFYAVDICTSDLLDRSVKASVGGAEVPSLSPEDLLMVLCLHAAKHLWMRLIWVADIAETLRTPSLDFALLLSRAQAAGIERVLAVSFWLAREVLSASLPEPAELAVAADSQAAILGREFALRLARTATYDFESPEYFRLFMKLRERPSDRLQYLWRLVWTPGPGDVAAVELPEVLFPLYRVVRLGRLIRKLV